MTDTTIQEEHVTPDQAKIGPAAAAIVKAYPAVGVSIYLNTLLFQDPHTWEPCRDDRNCRPEGPPLGWAGLSVKGVYVTFALTI